MASVHGYWLPQRLRGQLSLTLIFVLRALKIKGLEYPRDYKLLNVGGTASSFAALSSGQIAAAMQELGWIMSSFKHTTHAVASLC